METVMNKLKELGVVSVVRGNTLQEGLEIARACIRGGLTAIEVTFTNAYAPEIIKTLVKEYENEEKVCIGAGTVLTREQAKAAYEAGAKFIVSPAFTQEVSDFCKEVNTVYTPGTMTVTEMVNAMNEGNPMVKLFPGSVFGPGYIKSVKSPLPNVQIMVTGGVSLNNAKDWFNAGVAAIGVGGEFNKLGVEGKFDEIEKMACEYMAIFKEVRG